MPEQAPVYDLMLLLSTGAPEEQRTKILSDVESSISSSGGSISRQDEWGVRAMAYQIQHQPDAEYHLLQFSAPAELLESLSYNLRIADGVLRHRIIKAIPGSTAAPPAAPTPAPAAVSTSAPPPAAAGPSAASDPAAGPSGASAPAASTSAPPPAAASPSAPSDPEASSSAASDPEQDQ